MKYLFISILLIATIGCNTEVDRTTYNEGLKAEGDVTPDFISKFTYEEHHYIWFEPLTRIGTIVHDPDCPCTK